jgi:hypothetical protein
MIVISAGLQKSGSGLFFNLTNDMLQAAGKEDTRQIRNQFGLEKFIEHYNCNVGELAWEKLKPLVSLHFKGKCFAIKTHNPPTSISTWLTRLNILRPTFIYRDPRDVVLSALAHGKKIVAKGENHTFAVCTSFEKTIPMVRSWLDSTVLPWLQSKSVHAVKYENLIQEPLREMKRLAQFLDISIDDSKLADIYGKYDPRSLDDFQKDYLHFNKGKAGDFRNTMSPEELDMCNRQFGSHLEIMGYSPK